jgi:hypothetical protein
MEFHVNLGVPGLLIGFLALGCALALLDRKAALAESRGDLGRTILLFLPAVALIQPNGSMVEMFGGAAAAVVAAYGWKWGWEAWGSRASPHRARYVMEDPQPPGRAYQHPNIRAAYLPPEPRER